MKPASSSFQEAKVIALVVSLGFITVGVYAASFAQRQVLVTGCILASVLLVVSVSSLSALYFRAAVAGVVLSCLCAVVAILLLTLKVMEVSAVGGTAILAWMIGNSLIVRICSQSEREGL